MSGGKSKIKFFLKALAAVVLVVISLFVYSFLQFRAEIQAVYKLPSPFAMVYSENADLTVVEFVDYNCQASREIYPILKEAVLKDGRVNYFPIPVVTEGAPAVTRELISFLLASARQVSLPLIHDKIIQNWPVNNLDDLKEFAKASKMDVDKLLEDMKSIQVEKEIDLYQGFYTSWNVGGTPTLLIATPVMGTKAMFTGASKTPTVDELLAKFERARGWF